MSARFRSYVDRWPVAFTILLAAALAAFLALRHTVLPTRLTYSTVVPGEAGLLAGALALVALLGWWRRAGLAVPLRFDWSLALLPACAAYYLLLGSAAFFVHTVASAGFVLALLVGAAEEILCRGIVLEALRPTGRLAAAAGSAVFFGVLHLNNLLLVPAPGVVAQAVYAVLLGLFFAAVRLRVLSIWPVALTHAAIDVPGLATGHFAPPGAAGPWLPLAAIAVSLPWAAVGVGILAWDETRR